MFSIPRITKDPQVRQAELMDTAMELFLSTGYLKTTVQDIVKTINVAQGTFYYYFSSKEAIVEGIHLRHVQNMIAEFYSSDDSSPLERLQLFINLFYKFTYTGETAQLYKLLYKEKQGLLINKLWRQTHLTTQPLLIKILEACNQEGLTRVVHMNETLWFFGGIMGSLFEACSPLEYGHESDQEVMNNKMQIAEKLMENLFGAPAGSIKLSVDVLTYKK